MKTKQVKSKFKIFIILVSIIAIIVSFIFLLALPYLIYLGITMNLINPAFYALPNHQKSLFYNHEIDPEYLKDTDAEEDRAWDNLHFATFRVPMPSRNPLFHFIPDVKYYGPGKLQHLGINYVNARGELLANFEILESVPFRYQHPDDSPLIKIYLQEYVTKELLSDLWQQMFTRNIKKTFGPYRNLLDHLFILYLRSRYFPEDTQNFTYHSEKKLGIVRIAQENSSFDLEEVWQLKEGIIHKYRLKTLKHSNEVRKLHTRFLMYTEFKADELSDADAPYSFFRQLPFNIRTTPAGIIYLFAAWSHVTDNSKYLREMIHFLERGKNNYELLQPLYAYAMDRFDQNLSLSTEINNERAAREKKEAKSFIKRNVKKKGSHRQQVLDLIDQAKKKEEEEPKKTDPILIID